MTANINFTETEEAERYSTTRAWAVTIMLVLLAVINWADKAVLGLVAVPLMEDFDIGPAEYGLLASAIYFLFSAAAILGGFLANRRTSKSLLGWMVVIWSVSQFSIWLAPTFAVVFVSRIVLGFGEGPAAGLSYHSVAKWFPDEKRNLPVAMQSVGAFGGVAVAAPALTWIISNYDWHWAFFAVGAVGFVWLVVWVIVGKEGPFSGRSDSPVETVADGGSVFDTAVRAPYRTILLSRSFIGCIFVGLAAYWGLAVLTSWLPAYLRSSQGYSAGAAATIVTAASLTAIVFLVVEALITTRLMSRGVSSRVARAGLASTSVVVAGALIVAGATLPDGTFQVVALVVGFGLGLVTFTTGAVTLSEFVPVLQRGGVLGLYVAIVTTAGLVAPVLFGWIVALGSAGSGSGYPLALSVSGIVMLTGGVLGLLLIHPAKDAARVQGAFRFDSAPTDR